MRDKTLTFSSPAPVRAFRKPGRVWSLEGSCGAPDAAIWVHCHSIAYPHLAGDNTRVFRFPLAAGFPQRLWFDQGFPFPHGMVLALSAVWHQYEPLDVVPAGLEIRVGYRTDAEITQEAKARARWERQPEDPHAVAASLAQFLRSGNLGPIHLGMARTTVLDMLGKPDDWSTDATPAGLPAIFKYGDIECYFDSDDDTLVCLRADNFEVLSGGAAVHLDAWTLQYGTAQHEVEAQLTAQGIDYRPAHPRNHPPEVTFLKTGGGVVLGFDLRSDDDTTYRLESISWNGGRDW